MVTTLLTVLDTVSDWIEEPYFSQTSKEVIKSGIVLMNEVFILKR